MTNSDNKRGTQCCGSIRKKTVIRNGVPDTCWEARVTTGLDLETGRQSQLFFSGKTQKEILQKMLAALADLNEHEYRESTLKVPGMTEESPV